MAAAGEFPLILWFRRDLRVSDHPMLTAAVATGRPLLPVFVLDAETEALGAAAKFRLGLALQAFSTALAGLGSRLILRRGTALAVLQALVAETGASGVMWQRQYDPAARARDAEIKAVLREQAVQAESFPGALLIEPWQVAPAAGGFYKVFTPFWRAVAQQDIPAPFEPIRAMRPMAVWPASDALSEWRMSAAMRRGAAVVGAWQHPGEAAALAQLRQFLDGPISSYGAARDDLGRIGATSGLSEGLAWGEIGPRAIWHAALGVGREGAAGAETFRKELVWREFAAHLLFHTPHLLNANWREGWDGFAWRGDNPDAEAWRRGLTGEPVVDAAMREMYVTGRMHNRARMIVASYLTKHLLTDWRVGQAWFAECLTDWDAASNAMGWQWVAGCGPDSAPYFRVFNPATQAEKFDPARIYRRRWIAEGEAHPADTALSYFDAVPHSWRIGPGAAYPRPIVDLAEGRARALAAYAQRNA